MRLLTLALLVACKAPSIDPQIRSIWSFEFDQCYCQLYDLNKIEPLEPLYKCDFTFCEDLVGFKANIWTNEITPWGKEVRAYGEDECK